MVDEEIKVPVLVLPEPIPVRPPKYSYERYEQEEKDWKGNTDSWRTEQRRRWTEGWADLVGIHYFYLTQMKIKDGDGQLIRPIWRDVDEFILREFMECLEDERDLYVFKRREVGLSSIFGGLIPLWITIHFPGSTSLMTSADLTRVADLLKNKFVAQHGALEDWVAPIRKTYDQKKGEVVLAETDPDTKKPTGNEAEIKCRETSKERASITKLEGARAKYAFLDELFLHPFPEEVRGSVESCLLKGMERTGIMVSGGSAGSVSRLGLKQAKAIWNSAEFGAIKCIFLEGSKGIMGATIRGVDGKKIGSENFCINGWSDMARAEAYIMWQRAIYDMNPDKTELNSFIKRYPLNIDEVFQSDELGTLPKEITDLIPIQERELDNHPRNIRRYKYRWDEERKPIKTLDDKGGFWWILEEPIPGELYIAGADPIPFNVSPKEMKDAKNEEDRSKFGQAIKRVSTNRYVAFYFRRSHDVGLVYEEINSCLDDYNGAQSMVERNRGEVWHDRHRLNGELNRLAYQPVWIGAKAYKKNSIRGWYKTGNEERALESLFDYLKKYMYNIDFPIILEQLRGFGQENTDLIDAMISCEIFHKGIKVTDAAKSIQAQKAQYKRVPYKTDINGKTVVRYRKTLVKSRAEENKDNEGHDFHAIFPKHT